MTPPRGPVFLDFPLDVVFMEAEEPPAPGIPDTTITGAPRDGTRAKTATM